MEVKYKLRGKVHTHWISSTNEYEQDGYQWNNILAVIADCGSEFPQVIHIDSDIDFAKEQIEIAEDDGDMEEVKSWQETLAFFERIKSEGREFRVALSYSDQELLYKDEVWFNAEDREDACKKALLELGYGEGELIYIKDYDGSFIYNSSKE